MIKLMYIYTYIHLYTYYLTIPIVSYTLYTLYMNKNNNIVQYLLYTLTLVQFDFKYE